MEHTQWATDADLLRLRVAASAEQGPPLPPSAAKPSLRCAVAEAGYGGVQQGFGWQCIAEEIADVAILLTGPCPGLRAGVAHDLNVDMEEAVRRKLLKNAVKYPVERARGVATKYDRL